MQIEVIPLFIYFNRKQTLDSLFTTIILQSSSIETDLSIDQ